MAARGEGERESREGQMENDEETREGGRRELRAPCSALMNIFIDAESHERTPT